MQPSFNFLDKTISLFNLDTMALTIHYAFQTQAHLFTRGTSSFYKPEIVELIPVALQHAVHT